MRFSYHPEKVENEGKEERRMRFSYHPEKVENEGTEERRMRGRKREG